MRDEWEEWPNERSISFIKLIQKRAERLRTKDVIQINEDTIKNVFNSSNEKYLEQLLRIFIQEYVWNN